MPRPSRSSRRSRAASGGGAPAARLRALAPVPGGWVPPAVRDVPAPRPPADGLLPEVRRGPDRVAPAADRAGPVGSRLAVLRAARVDPGGPGVAVLVAVALAAAALAGAYLLGSRPAAVPAPPPATVVEQPGAPAPAGADAPGGSSPAAGEPPGEVVVAVAGTVARPGVVRLPAGSRVVDALEAAGGLSAGADPGLLNLARVLADGEQVLVGVEAPPGAVAAGGPPGAAALGADGLLDLNAATAGDLDELPGVGPVLAERIVEHRERAGPFASVDQLREVDGIGESRYDDLAPRVVVR